MDEDDPIIEEIPVYLSKALKDQLYLLQYTNRSNSTSLNKMKVSNCFVKPFNQEVKIDFAIDTNSIHYDSFKAERLADVKINKPSFEIDKMNKQTLTSTKSIENPNKYIVGIFENNELHLSPINSILQLRPSFSYFDKQDIRNKAEEKANNDFEDEEELKEVTVSFSRMQNEKFKKAKEKSYSYYVKKKDDEPWCEAFWHSEFSSLAKLERKKLISSCSDSNSQIMNLDSKMYIEKLILHKKLNNVEEVMNPNTIFTKAKLKTLTLVEQIKIILKEVKIIDFNGIMQILESFTRGITEEKVLKTLPLVGTLIRGNWVVQSDILYPPNTFSITNGIASSSMIRARDYILFQFSKREFLLRKILTVATQIPHEEVLEILQSVAKRNSRKMWELLIPSDKSFEINNPDLVQRQNMIWRAQESKFNEMEHEKYPKRARKRSIKEVKNENL